MGHRSRILQFETTHRGLSAARGGECEGVVSLDSPLYVTRPGHDRLSTTAKHGSDDPPIVVLT